MSNFFSERLAVAIAKSGKSKGSLASHCGVALSTVSRWMSGSIPKAETISKIAAFLGVDAKWLFPTSNELKDMLAAETQKWRGILDLDAGWTAANEANFELGIQHRVKELASESEEKFALRMTNFADRAAVTLQNAIGICEMIRNSSHASASDLPDNRQVEDVALDLMRLLGEVSRIKAESLALRRLAESSPLMLQILRTKH